MDPWKEALSCFEYFADEIIIVGKEWPYEFKWDYIGKVFQEGFEKCRAIGLLTCQQTCSSMKRIRINLCQN